MLQFGHLTSDFGLFGATFRIKPFEASIPKSTLESMDHCSSPDSLLFVNDGGSSKS
jgi:hypothetical protein